MASVSRFDVVGFQRTVVGVDEQTVTPHQHVCSRTARVDFGSPDNVSIHLGQQMEIPFEVYDRDVATDRGRSGQVSEAQINVLPADALPIAQESADGAVVISNVDIAKPDTDT